MPNDDIESILENARLFLQNVQQTPAIQQRFAAAGRDAAYFQQGQAYIDEVEQEAFSALVARRRQLLKMRIAEKNRLGTAPSEAVARSIETVLATIEEQINEAEEQLQEAVEESPMW